jgi:hypothetical protein
MRIALPAAAVETAQFFCKADSGMSRQRLVLSRASRRAVSSRRVCRAGRARVDATLARRGDLFVNAWLLTWEGTSGMITAQNKIAAIISSRRSSAFVYDVVDLLYGRTVDSAYDVARSANRRSARRDELLAAYSTSQRFFFGRNPFLFARRVSDLRVVRHERQNLEVVTWIDPPYLRIEKPGDLPVAADSERRCTLRRHLQSPLSSDLYGTNHADARSNGHADIDWYASETIR